MVLMIFFSYHQYKSIEVDAGILKSLQFSSIINGFGLPTE